MNLRFPGMLAWCSGNVIEKNDENNWMMGSPIRSHFWEFGNASGKFSVSR